MTHFAAFNDIKPGQNVTVHFTDSANETMVMVETIELREIDFLGFVGKYPFVNGREVFLATGYTIDEI